MKNLTIEKARAILLEMGTSEETLQTVTDINGYNMKTMESILYVQHGYECFSQLD